MTNRKKVEGEMSKVSKVELLKKRKEAYRIWARTEGKARLSRIAKDVGLTVEEVEYYKDYDRWEERLEKAKKNNKVNEHIKEGLKELGYKPETQEELDELQEILDNAPIKDRHKLFIMYYLQTYNVKQAAINAGYSKHSANVRGNAVLKDPKVVEVLNKIKKLMHENIYIRAHDIVEEYIKIAFADITDFVEFEGNKVRLKSSDKIDGRVITEVKQGKDGITIKMADKMKALERLEKLFEIIPDRRLELENKKFELQKKVLEQAGQNESNITIINDIS